MSKPKPVNAMTQTVKVTLPKAPSGQSQSVYVGLNQRDYLIPPGQEVELPLPVWEILRMSMRAEALVDAQLREN